MATKVIGPGVPQQTRVNAIVANGRIFMGIVSDADIGGGKAATTVTILSTDLDGNSISMPRQIVTAPTNCICGAWRTSLAWDGGQLLAGWPQSLDAAGSNANWKVVGVRFNADGPPIDTQPFAITSIASTEFVAATSTAGVLLLSSEYRHGLGAWNWGSSDLYARHVRSFAQLTTGSTAGSVVQSSAVQFEPAIAASGSRAMVVWRELDQPSAIRAATVDVSASATSPALTVAERSDVPKTGVGVAALRDVALVTWREETDNSVRIMAERVSFSGTALDAQSIAIATHETYRSAWPATTSIASDGSQFLVVWNVDQDVFAARVLADGTPLDQAPLVVSRESSGRYSRRIDPRVVWTGSSFLVIWSDDIDCHCLLISPPQPPWTIVRTARVTSAGAVLDSTESPTLVNHFGAVAEVAIARNGTTLMAVWSGSDDDEPNKSKRCLHALPLDLDGRPVLSSPVQFECEALDTWPPYVMNDVTVTAKDSGFAVFWSANRTRDVRARLLSTTGAAGDPFVVSTRAQDAWRPAAADSPFGTLVVYSRLTDATYGRAAHLFGRVLDQMPARKSRAARH